VLLCFKPTRRLAIIWGLVFQLVLALSMHLLVYFMLVMTCFYVLFLDDRTLHRFVFWEDGRFRSPRSRPPQTV
jgi:hypothetical protein